jgi:outer membrane protein assembly factor BamB
MTHGGSKHGGLSPYNTSHVDGTIVWTFETGWNIESSPVIGPDGTIYIGSHDNTFYAVNPNGTQKWNFSVGEPLYDDRFDQYKGILSTPAIAEDGTIYFSSLSDYFFALNPDGTEKWRIRLAITSDTWTSPVIGPDGTIYTGSARRFHEGFEKVESETGSKESFFAFNPDGTIKWSYFTSTDICSSPVIGDDGTIYFGTYVQSTPLGRVFALNPDGTKKWHFDTDGLIESSPSIGPDGTIYIGAKGGQSYGTTPQGWEKWPGHVYAINPDGTQKWIFDTTGGVSAIPAIGEDGTIYCGSWDCYLYAINADGTKKWDFKTPDAFEGVCSSVAIGSDGTLYVGSNYGTFYAIHPDGSEKWNYTHGAGFVSTPAIGEDGRIYVASWKHLYAFGASSDVEEEDEENEGYDDIEDYQPIPDNNETEDMQWEPAEDDEAPGFEIGAILCAVSIILIVKKKKKNIY